jgi:hypothetical protein
MASSRQPRQGRRQTTETLTVGLSSRQLPLRQVKASSQSVRSMNMSRENRESDGSSSEGPIIQTSTTDIFPQNAHNERGASTVPTRRSKVYNARDIASTSAPVYAAAPEDTTDEVSRQILDEINRSIEVNYRVTSEASRQFMDEVQQSYNELVATIDRNNTETVQVVQASLRRIEDEFTRKMEEIHQNNDRHTQYMEYLMQQLEDGGDV